jgi:hypothetical protein
MHTGWFDGLRKRMFGYKIELLGFENVVYRFWWLFNELVEVR